MVQLNKLERTQFSQKGYVSLFLNLLSQFVKETHLSHDLARQNKFGSFIEEKLADCPELFKSIDEEVTNYLAGQIDFAVSSGFGERYALASALDASFQRLRGHEAYRSVIETLFQYAFGGERPTALLVAGCGEFPEAACCLALLPETRFYCVDIDKSATELLATRMTDLSPGERNRLSIVNADLTESESFDKMMFDGFVFFHPLVLDFKHYASLLRSIVFAASRREQEEIAASSRVSDNAAHMLEAIISRLPAGGRGLITSVDYLEAQALSYFLQGQKQIQYTIRYNPYAIRKLGVFLTRHRTPREYEQRTYHFLFSIVKIA